MICHQLNLIILIWELFYFSGIVSEKACDLKELFICSPRETCHQLRDSSTVGVCRCKNQYVRGPDGTCIEQSNLDNPSLPTAEDVYSLGRSVAAVLSGVLTAAVFVGLVASLVFVAKKYRWVHRVREKAQRFRERHYDTVLVNHEDDPPLA